MALRKAILSRHIIQCKHSRSVYGIVLIEGESIAEVIVADPSKSIPALLQEYADWNPEDCSQLYLSPGLIDCNVRANGDWEGRERMTKAAVSGGVTLVVEEPNVYGLEDGSGELYCDVGACFLVHSRNLADLKPAVSSGVLAVKAYMSAPSAYIPSVEDVLPEVLETVGKAKIPLFLDPSQPHSRHIFMASPCRLLTLEARRAFDGGQGSSFFAGAFPDEAEDSDQEEELLSKDLPVRTISHVGAFGSRMSRRIDNSPNTIKRNTRVLSNVAAEAAVLEHGHSKDIYEDLDKRIKKSAATTEDLADLEYSDYLADGPTTYVPKRRSSSFNSPLLLTPISLDPAKDHLQGFRPSALAIHKQTEEAKDDRDSEYLYFLANYPDRWESKGVKRVTEMLPYSPCRVHFTNLSSANAVNHVRKFKEDWPDVPVTCETCPHYLYWASDAIPNGTTLLKTTPPIRNRSNKQLLWELLKVKAVDMLSSHHCPVDLELKFQESGSFRKALSGITGLGFSLQAVWTRLMEETASEEEQEHYLVRLAKWMAAAPAKMLGLRNRGGIERGKLADLVLWAPREICTQDSLSKHPELNPYCSEPLFGRIHRVYVRGQLAFANGRCFPVGRPINNR
jgi:dihydroorotase-like cyclic amidohydrolase